MIREKIKAEGMGIPKLKSCRISVEPLWGDDTGRETMDASFGGTFKGWFTKIKLEIGRTTIEELNFIKNLLEKPIVSFSYPIERDLGNIKAGKEYTEQFYGTAIETEFNNYKGKYDSFSITLTAVKRRPLDV